MLRFMIHFSTMLSLQKPKQEDSDSFTAELTARADSPTEAAPRARPGRLKKPVQYLESSDDDMFWIFMKFLNYWSVKFLSAEPLTSSHRRTSQARKSFSMNLSLSKNV